MVSLELHEYGSYIFMLSLFLLCWSSFTSKITFTSKVLLVKLKSEIKQPKHHACSPFIPFWTLPASQQQTEPNHGDCDM